VDAAEFSSVNGDGGSSEYLIRENHECTFPAVHFKNNQESGIWNLESSPVK